MSSFVVNKSEYIKAAGIVSGLAELYADRYGTTHRIWIYDYVTGRNMTPDDYYRNFVDCYTMNALSVQEQYNDAEPETDEDDYMELFNEYRVKIKRITNDRVKMQEVILQLHDFFKCAEYQTEKECYFWKMNTFFNRINAALLPFMAPAHKTAGWGSLEL